MNTLADRLTIAIDAAGITKAELARRVGISAPSVNGWFTGKAKFLRGENLLAAARALDVDQDWLASGKGAMQRHVVSESAAASYLQPSAISSTETQCDYVRVEQIDATAGMGGAVINDDHPEIIRSVEYREAYIRALIGFVPPPGRLKLVTGAGDSMRPVIEPGEAVLMDSGVTTFQADGIYWIALGDRDDGHQIKMLQERGDGLWVISANPNYPPFPFPESGRIGGRLYIRHKIERFS